jgi:hypothetical protein
VATDYKLRFYNPAGTLTAEVNDFLDLQYSKEVNKPGYLEFRLNGDHAAIADLSLNSQVEVYRKNTAMGLTAWTCDFYGLWEYQRYEYTDREVFVGRCPGQLAMLGWRIVNWVAETSNRSSFSSAKAETVMKTLVDYNLGANATTGNGRLRAGDMTGISCAADGAAGNTVDWACCKDNLLETLQRLADVGGGDFDLVKTAAAMWEFRWYTGQLGTDRTATVIFSLPRGNMASPVYIIDRTEERTVACVGGQGQGAQRATVTRTGTDYNATTNNREMFVQANNVTTTAGLNTVGDMRLLETEQKKSLSFKVVQTPSCFYGVHYFLGDLVTGYYKTSGTFKVQSVSVNVGSDGSEQVSVGLKNA